jgi:hypothetical protein
MARSLGWRLILLGAFGVLDRRQLGRSVRRVPFPAVAREYAREYLSPL